MVTGELFDYQRRVAGELARYRQVTNVHDLPAIYSYWEQHHVDPLRRKLGFESLGDLLLRPLVAASRVKSQVRAVSLGSGNGDLELGLMAELREGGVDNVILERLELNDAMRGRAERDAQQAGLSAHLVDVAADLNAWEADRDYDVVIANHSLHHVVELEHLFDQVQMALADDGVFVVNDMIGRNGHMRWPEALDLIQRIWAVMPDRYRFNHQLQRHEPAYENWDCSAEGFEGVRAQDILPLLNATFHPEVFLAFANVIDLFVDRGFGHNFDVDESGDRAFIDAVAQLDEAALALGLVKPTHLVAHYRTQPVPCRYVEPMSPAFSVRAVDPERAVSDATGGAAVGEPEPNAEVNRRSSESATAKVGKYVASLVPPIRRLRAQRDELAAEVTALRARH